MGKQKYTAKEKKVSRMTRNGLVEENLATKETRKVTNSDQELPYKQKDVEQAFITSEKKKNSHKKAEKKQFSEKVQEGNPAKKEEAANSPPGKRKTQGRYRYRDKPAGVSVDSAVEIRERKEKHRSQYQRQKKKQQRLQFGKLETDGSLKKEKKTSAETDGGHFQAEKNDVSTNRKKGKQKYSRKTIKTYQEVDKAARKQEAERQNKIPKDSVYTKKTNEEQKAKVKYHLYFDKKTGKTDGKKKTLSSVPKKALKNAVYQKAGEDEKELGRRLGYGESSADVRIAQYESGQRTPKQETLIRIAEILEVDVRNFLSPGIATMDELMETLFWMDEENRGLFHLFLLNDSESETVGITIRDKKTMSYLQEWMGKKQKLGDGRITEEEYLEWKLHWPEDKRKTEYKTV